MFNRLIKGTICTQIKFANGFQLPETVTEDWATRMTQCALSAVGVIMGFSFKALIQGYKIHSMNQNSSHK